MCAPRASTEARSHAARFFGCLPGHPRHHSSVVRDRAAMRRAHLWPQCPRRSCERTLRRLMIWNSDHQFAKHELLCLRITRLGVFDPKTERPPRFPLAALPSVAWSTRQAGRGPPREGIPLLSTKSSLEPRYIPTAGMNPVRPHDTVAHGRVTAVVAACVAICRGRFTSLLALARRLRMADGSYG